MAQGDTIFLSDSDIWVGAAFGTSGQGIDKQISGYVATGMLHLEHPEVPTPHLFGLLGQQTSVSPHYSASMTLDLITDGWAAGGLDDIITSHMRPPLGPEMGNGRMWVWVRPGGVTGDEAWPAGRVRSVQPTPNPQNYVGRGGPSVAYPVYIGQVVVSQWDPLGPGVAGEMIRQNRSFTGHGNWWKYTAPSGNGSIPAAFGPPVGYYS